MTKYKNIEDFINNIVMTFSNNVIIDKFLKQLYDFNEYGSYEIIENNISWRSNNKRKRCIFTLDLDNKTIEKKSFGVKGTGTNNNSYLNFYRYSETPELTVHQSCNRNYTIDNNNRDEILITSVTSETYKYYKQNDFIGCMSTLKESQTVKDKHNGKINNDEHNESEFIYVLSTGDRIKMEQNDEEKHYYLYNKTENNDDKIFREITKDDFEKLITLSNNPYNLINSETYNKYM